MDTQFKQWLLAGCLVLLPGMAFCVEPANSSDTLHLDTDALAQQDLAQYRGSFGGLDGPLINFGLERMVLIDGIVEYQNQFQIFMDKVQVGVHPVSNGQAIQDAMHLVIQNTRDHALIQNLHKLNIEIGNLGQLKGGALQSLLLPQLIQSLK